MSTKMRRGNHLGLQRAVLGFAYLGKHVLRQDVRQASLPEIVRIDVDVVRPQVEVRRRDSSHLNAERQHTRTNKESSK